MRDFLLHFMMILLTGAFFAPRYQPKLFQIGQTIQLIGGN